MDRLVYRDDCGSERVCLGRRIYRSALEGRRGFRPDQIGIPEDDGLWEEIFDAIGEAAESANLPHPAESGGNSAATD